MDAGGPFALSQGAAMAAAMGAFLLLFGSLKLFARRLHPEVPRKLLHTGSGLLTLPFPFLFTDVWPVLVLTFASGSLLAAAKFLGPMRRRLGGVASGVDRDTLGELYFPISVGLLFWLSHGQSPLLFCIPILVLALADATSAVVGMRYGQNRFIGATKSLEGSVAFLVVAFFCIHVPIVIWGAAGAVESLLIAATLAMIVMLLEGSAWRGLDNLFIPIGGYFVLRVYLTLDAPALLPRFLITLALVIAVILTRRQTTLGDDALLGGAVLCYVTWAFQGWHWLVPPLIVFVGHAWLSPRTRVNSARIHDIPALLSIWAPAVPWLWAATALDAPRLLYPYTVAFACHLAMFGASRLASDFTDRPLRPLLVQAVAKGWAIVFLPYLLLEGPDAATALRAVLALAPVSLAVAGFVWLLPVRQVPLTRWRWVVQAVLAGVGSVLAAW